MKILYGVQATGNGHITRARAMAAAFAKTDIQVDFLFSGRPREELFDMQAFGDFQVRRGITFATGSGRVIWSKTLLKNNLFQLLRDTAELDASSYDLVISDYEPITARAGKRAGIKVIGLGHQYAFTFSRVPMCRTTPVHRWVMNNLAPADIALGLHWDQFDCPVLPPIAPVEHFECSVEKGLNLVYLPFENLDSIAQFLGSFADYNFIVYHPDATHSDRGNISFRPPSRAGFQEDLHRAEAVICNAGFELPSEALQLGKKLLVKPVAQQMEQQSNAIALERLNLGSSMSALDISATAKWLASSASSKVTYPDVAQYLVDWIVSGRNQSIAHISSQLWDATKTEHFSS